MKCVIIVNELRQPLSGTVWANLPMLSHKKSQTNFWDGQETGGGATFHLKYIFRTGTDTHIHTHTYMYVDSKEPNAVSVIYASSYTCAHTHVDTHTHIGRMEKRNLVKMCNVDPTPFSFVPTFGGAGRQEWIE